MSEPTTDQIRNAYIDTGWAPDGSLGEPRDGGVFDTWLASHDAEVRRESARRIAVAIESLPVLDADRCRRDAEMMRAYAARTAREAGER